MVREYYVFLNDSILQPNMNASHHCTRAECDYASACVRVCYYKKIYSICIFILVPPRKGYRCRCICMVLDKGYMCRCICMVLDVGKHSAYIFMVVKQLNIVARTPSNKTMALFAI